MNIQTLREKYPQYNDLSDKQLADAIHNEFYSDMPINQLYAKIGFQQSQPQNNINSQPQQSSTFTQPQQSNNYTQPKITTNKPANTQSQIAANTTINNKDYEINPADVAIPFLLIVVQIIFIFNINKRKIIQSELYNREQNTSNSYKILFNFSLILSILTFIGTLIEFNETKHSSGYVFFIIYQTWLIHNKNAVKLVNYTRFFLWLDGLLFIMLTGLAINGDDFDLHGTIYNTNGLLFYNLFIVINAIVYYKLLHFFKNQVIIENEANANRYSSQNNNSRYNNNNNDSQYDYRHNRQQEHTSSNNQNNYKKQDDDKSNNNNNYQYEKKQNDQSYHSKNSDSNQHSTFDDRLDELNSNIAKCYEILEVPQNATPSEIKSAFKKKMSSYHPDKVSGLDEKLRKVAEEESKLINVAYQNLKSKGKC